MHKIPIAAATALALMTVAAAAQTTSSPGTTRSPTTTAPATVPRPPAINPLTKEDVSAIDGTSVYSGDEKVGHVSTVLMDPQSKKIDRLVVTAGGVLGVGGHRVAIAIDQFKWDGGKGAFQISQTMAQLKEMPEWVEGASSTATGSSQMPKSEKSSTGAGNGKPAPASEK